MSVSEIFPMSLRISDGSALLRISSDKVVVTAMHLQRTKYLAINIKRAVSVIMP